MQKGILKSVTTEMASAAMDNAFAELATAAGFPAAIFAVPFAKGLVLGLVENCFNDCAQMTLSKNEKKKLNRCFEVALQTFWELSEQDGVMAWEMNIEPAYIDYAYEVAEHATLESIRQSEKKKIDVLGRFYGRQFYKRKNDWQDMHQIITMVSALTFRQIVMIRLISEGFNGIDSKLFIHNPAACVEINRLKDYGIWQTEGASFGINESSDLQLDSIIPTTYSNEVCDALVLERISDEDVKRTIESLCLTCEGKAQQQLTEDEFKEMTTYKVEGTKLILPGGKKYGGDPDESAFLYDLARGK